MSDNEVSKRRASYIIDQDSGEPFGELDWDKIDAEEKLLREVLVTASHRGLFDSDAAVSFSLFGWADDVPMWTVLQNLDKLTDLIERLLNEGR